MSCTLNRFVWLVVLQINVEVYTNGKRSITFVVRLPVYHIRESRFHGDLAKLGKKENRPTAAATAVEEKRKFCIQTLTLCIQTKAKGLSKLCTSSCASRKKGPTAE